MAPGQEFAGFQQSLFLAPETVWGQTPGTPTYLYLPYAAYETAVKPQAVQPQLFTGLYERRESRVTRTMLDGNLNVPLFGYQVAGASIAQYLLNWCLTRVTPVYLQSYLAELSENGVDNKRHNGLRVNQLTLSGDSNGGVINAQLQLMGSLETGGIVTQAVPTSTPQPVEFLFGDCTMTVGGAAMPIRSFSLTVKNNLQTKFTNNQWPTLIHAGVREIEFTFSIYKNANTYDLLARLTGAQNTTMSLLLKGLHLGTGPGSTTYTTVQIDFGRASFAGLTKKVSLNDLVQQSPRYIVLKPDSAADELTMTYGAV